MIGVILAGLAAFVVLSGGTFLAVFGRWPRLHDLTFPHDLVVIPVLWAGSFATNYCIFAVTVMADDRLRGGPGRIGPALREANRRLWKIVAWTLLAGVIGLVLQVLAERLNVGGLVAQWILGLAWTAATLLIIPVLVFEDISVPAALRRSATMVKTHWGTNAVAEGAVGSALAVVLLPLLVACAVVAFFSPVVAVISGVVAVAAFITVAGAVTAVVNVALYRYALTGTPPGPFSTGNIESLLKRRPPRRRLGRG